MAAVFPLMKFFIAEPGLSSAPSLAKAAARRSAIIAASKRGATESKRGATESKRGATVRSANSSLLGVT